MSSNSLRQVVLGQDILQEVWADQTRSLLPSCISAAPREVGGHARTLSADEWRSFASVHLIITLVRLWRFGGERKRQMLDNYLHLIAAIQIASLRSTSSDHIAAYEFHYREYLEGFKQLYKEVPLNPSNHFAQHYGEVLSNFGSAHPIRAWAGERLNKLLRMAPKNGKPGVFCSTVHSY